MCRVPPKIATPEVQNLETATCRDLLLMMISNHACCWCYSPAGGGRLLVLSWWWVTWSCCSLYNKLTLSRQFELFPMRHAVRLPLSLPIGSVFNMLRLANTLPLLGRHYKIEEQTYQYSSAVSGTIYMLLRHRSHKTLHFALALLCHMYHVSQHDVAVCRRAVSVSG